MKYNKILIIGGNRYKENGPLINFVDMCLAYNLEVFIYTDPSHWSMLIANNNYFSEEVTKRNVKVFVEKDLNFEILRNLDNRNMLVLCMNCIWIIKDNIINFFKGRKGSRWSFLEINARRKKQCFNNS